MYKGWTTITKNVVPDPADAGKFLVTFIFSKEGQKSVEHTDSMSVIDPKIARDFIDTLEAPAESAQKLLDNQKRIDEQKALVAKVVVNPPLGFFDLN